MADYPTLALIVAGTPVREVSETMPVTNPATGETLGRLPMASEADVDRAVKAAAGAAEAWRDLGASGRAAILRRVAPALRANADRLARLITLELGKPLAESRGEVAVAAALWDWNVEEGLRGYGRVVPGPTGGRRLVLREPLGPVAGFSSWNAPLITPSRKIGAALAAGCPIVMKPAEETPATALALATILVEAGVPGGVLSVLFGDAPMISSRLLADARIRGVSFTGSTAVGIEIGQAAMAGMKPATLELGGHAPVLIFDDVNPGAVARAAVAAKFRNAGQICTSPTRFVVQDGAYEAFREAFLAAASEIVVGDGMEQGTTMGPLAHARRLDWIEGLVSDATERGARILAGGARMAGGGFFFAPTILEGVPADARAMNEEPFGPLALLCRFRDEVEAMAEANRLPVGLTAYAFTSDGSRAIRLADGIRAGNVIVNGWAASAPETPFGGWGLSGLGKEGGSEGLEAFQSLKYVSLS